MPNYIFGGEDVEVRVGTITPQLISGGTRIDVYSDPTGTMPVSDFILEDGVPTDVLRVDSNSKVPVFSLASDVLDTLYLQINFGTLTAIHAHTGDLIEKHEDSTTDVHGIPDTSQLVTVGQMVQQADQSVDVLRQEVQAEKGVANGIGTLDVSGKQPESEVPDRLSSANLSASIADATPYGNAAIPPPDGKILSSFQGTETWVDSAGGWVADTSDFIYGSKSWKATSSGAGGVLSTYLEFATPVDIRGMNVLVDASLTNRDHVATFNVSVDSGASGFSALMQYQNETVRTRDRAWDQYLFPYSTAFDQVGTPNRAAMKRIRIRLTDDNTGHPVTLKVNRVRLVPTTGLAAYPAGVGTLDFDDCYDSVALAHGVLSKYGVPGVINTIVDNVDTTGHLTTQQLTNWCRQDGWGIQAHAYTGAAHNAPYTNLTVDQLEVECRGMKTWLREHGFDDEFFVYPTGAYNDTVTDVIRKHFRAARSTDTTPYTMPGVRSHRLSSLSIGPTTTTAEVKGYMDGCVASGLPFHLTLHKFEAGGATATPLAWGTDQLDEVVAYALGKGYTFARYPDIYGGKHAKPSQVLKVNTVQPVTDGVWRAGDSGFKAWSGDPATNTGSNYTLVSGTQYISRAKVDAAGVLSGVRFSPSTAGTSITEATCDVFDSTGALLCTANIAAALASTALANVTFTTPSRAMVVGETVYVGIRATFTGTAPAIRGLGTATIPNINTTGAGSRYATAGTGITAPLTSITPSALTATSVGSASLWVGLT